MMIESTDKQRDRILKRMLETKPEHRGKRITLKKKPKKKGGSKK